MQYPPAFAVYLVSCDVSDVICALSKPLAECVIFLTLYSDMIRNEKIILSMYIDPKLVSGWRNKVLQVENSLRNTELFSYVMDKIQKTTWD